MKFKSTSDGLYDVVLLIFFLFILYRFWADWHDDGKIMWGVQLFVFILTANILWMYFNLNYQIIPPYLKYRSGFVKGKIKIEEIRTITRGKTKSSGLKFARARKGLTIHYGNSGRIYISPEREEEFITALKNINHNIIIE